MHGLSCAEIWITTSGEESGAVPKLDYEEYQHLLRIISPRRARAPRGQVIALGLPKKFLNSLSEVYLNTGRHLMVSSTTLQLDKSSWPLQILLVCRLGKGLTT